MEHHTKKGGWQEDAPPRYFDQPLWIKQEIKEEEVEFVGAGSNVPQNSDNHRNKNERYFGPRNYYGDADGRRSEIGSRDDRERYTERYRDRRTEAEERQRNKRKQLEELSSYKIQRKLNRINKSGGNTSSRNDSRSSNNNRNEPDEKENILSQCNWQGFEITRIHAFVHREKFRGLAKESQKIQDCLENFVKVQLKVTVPYDQTRIVDSDGKVAASGQKLIIAPSRKQFDPSTNKVEINFDDGLRVESSFEWEILQILSDSFVVLKSGTFHLDDVKREHFLIKTPSKIRENFYPSEHGYVDDNMRCVTVGGDDDMILEGRLIANMRDLASPSAKKPITSYPIPHEYGGFRAEQADMKATYQKKQLTTGNNNNNNTNIFDYINNSTNNSYNRLSGNEKPNSGDSTGNENEGKDVGNGNSNCNENGNEHEDDNNVNDTSNDNENENENYHYEDDNNDYADDNESDKENGDSTKCPEVIIFNNTRIVLNPKSTYDNCSHLAGTPVIKKENENW